MRSAPSLHVSENFLSSVECNEIIASLAEYRNHYDVPLIYRPGRKRSLKYRVINGDEIQSRLPAIQRLYEGILPLVQREMAENVVPLNNRTVGVNINITPEGGAYRWHYDHQRRRGGALPETEVSGGEIETYPNYRLMLPSSKLVAPAELPRSLAPDESLSLAVWPQKNDSSQARAAGHHARESLSP